MACKESAKPGAVYPPAGSAGRVLSLRGVRCANCLRAQPGGQGAESTGRSVRELPPGAARREEYIARTATGAGGVLGLRGAGCANCLRAQPGQSKTDSDLTWRTWAVRASTAYSYSMAWYMKLTS